MPKHKRKALYPGSFDPVTYGHLDVIERAHMLFDEVHIAVAVNADKNALFSVDERIEFLKRALKNKKGIIIHSFQGLIVNYALSHGIQTLIRGLRATSDFDYEFQMAITNRRLAEEVETIFLMPSERFFYLSSRLIKEIAAWGGDVSHFVPKEVSAALRKRYHTK